MKIVIDFMLKLTLALFVILLCLSIVFYFYSYDGKSLGFCFTNDCLTKFIHVFSASLLLLKTALMLIPIFAFCIVSKNYLETSRNNMLNLCINRERDFNSFMKDTFGELDYDQKRFYLAIYDNPSQGSFKIKETTKKSIDLLISFLKIKGKNYVASRNQDSNDSEYRKMLKSVCDIFYIDLESDKDIKDLYEFESEFLTNIEYIIGVWAGYDIGFSKLQREYAPRS